MTGGGRGYCSPWGLRTGRTPYWGRGWGGRGYGYTCGYPGSWFAPGFATREQEMDYLRSEAESLKRTLEGIEARIQELAPKDK